MQFPDLPLQTPASPVNFYFEDVQFDLPDQQRISLWLQEAARLENVPFRELNCIFCSDEHLRTINIEYLNHDYYTDIISFPYAENTVYGDLFISADRVRDNAATNKVGFQHELCRVMVHGLLHLCGYGDKSPEEAATIRAKEDAYLSRLP